MQPTLVPRPIHHEGWVYEEKVDGWRMLAYKDGRHVRLISRNGKDHTAQVLRLAGPRPLPLEVLAAPPGRVYTGCMTISTERPEFEPDQIVQAVSVGLCLVLAAVLLALAGVVQGWSLRQ